MSTLDAVASMLEDLELLGAIKGALTMETRLMEVLHWDDLSLVECVLGLEDRFEIDIDDEVAETWQTVGDVVAYVEQHTKAGA